ncbi:MULTISPECIES: YqeG family HAD IIIA-type phosphatase [Atopobiaceae]|uniref:YqeG family HAD IIIA-type phosphatase n=1 Tax=Atopobiaceae TaxID=1643824 RepID=UPI000B36E31B|nr:MULTISPECIES: YqeG family HAD IIIA-type phosphatase [Atopobiaceae]MCR8907656.1 YqeG family HAD IIIA-type phosphatase [Thermophilibacter sp. ET337]OUO33333.1 haloacid dehalogenase [Olsenella sp. An293]
MGLFSATRYVASLPQVSVEGLVRDGVRLVLLDRDNTCVPRDAHAAPAAVEDWLARAREAGLELCLVSNNFHTSHVSRTARELGVDFVDHAMKPLPLALRRAMRRFGARPGETVMIGDQVYTDVAAGNLAGVRTVLVRPQSRADLWYTHVFRVFERLALRGRTFEGE